MGLRVRVPDDLISGDVDPGYGPVADAFRRNFSDRADIGAACAVWRDGRKVVDLWGGYRDGRTHRPWQPDTMVLVFSAAKGMASAAMAVAHAQGLYDLDVPVATYWPEFASSGKQDVTVRQLLAHQAGLASVSSKVPLELLADPDALGQVLASQAPAWEPGTRHGYHAVTLGWYQSQLLRRVDPAGRGIGAFFAEEIAEPLGADFHIGLPDHVPDERLATIHAFRPPEMLLHLNKMPTRLLVSMLNPFGHASRAMRVLPTLMNEEVMNQRATLALHVPSVIGVGEPRSLARVYGAMATGGAELGLQPATLAALEEPVEPPAGQLRDAVLQMDTLFSLGYVKPFPGFRFGTSSRAYGTPGAGGSFAMADPDAGIGYAYAMNRLGFHNPVDPRELALRQALYDVIGGPSQDPHAPR